MESPSGYVQQNREEMEVLFTLLAERYERRSILTSSNLVFSQWDQIFKDPMTTMAAIDRLVQHAIILEFDGASQRVKKGWRKGAQTSRRLAPTKTTGRPHPPAGPGSFIRTSLPPKSPTGDFSPPVPQGSGGKDSKGPPVIVAGHAMPARHRKAMPLHAIGALWGGGEAEREGSI